MLKEVNLASLSAVHREPVSIGKLLGEVSISRVGVTILWRGLLSRESSTVLFIELFHELAAEHSNANSHGEEVHSEHVLQDDCHRQDDAIQELLGDFVLVF